MKREMKSKPPKRPGMGLSRKDWATIWTKFYKWHDRDCGGWESQLKAVERIVNKALKNRGGGK